MLKERFRLNKSAYQECPRCGELKLQYRSRWIWLNVSIIAGFLFALFTLFLSLIIFPPVGLLMSLLIPPRYSCRNCRLSLKPSEYEAIQKEKLIAN